MGEGNVFMILGIDSSQANRKVRSGTEWYAFYLIQEFKKLLWGRSDVKVRLYLRDEPRADLVVDLPENFKVKILRWPLRYFWGQVRLSWEMLWHPPDTLFCPAHTIPLLHPKKTFTTLHDVGFEDYPELYDKLSLWYHRFAARLAVRKAYHIFTISQFSKDRIIENYNCDPNKLTVTNLGIDTKLTAVNFVSILEKYGLPSKGYLLYVGRLEPKKNILNIVKAYEMSWSELPLVLAGRKIRISEVEEYLESRPGLQAKVKFLNYIPEADKAALYAGAALFLFPTLYEGFGLPILEAQASGTPVITSNTASNPEVAGEGAVIVDPESPYEIAKAIRELLTNKPLRDEKVRKGFENVKQFSWEETAKLTLKTLGIID